MNFFETIVKRTANFSIQSYEENKHDLFDFFNNNELFHLCILTASESLFKDLNKNKSKKTNGSLYNYFIRAHFNPTPFGVFNSVGVLKWDKSTTIPKTDALRLMVKYDNLFVSLKTSSRMQDNFLDLSYCPNPSIHYLNDEKIGFYKSNNTGNDKIEISYIEVDVDEDLIWLLNQFKDGKRINTVVEELILQGFDRSEIQVFLLETIETGLFIETFLFDSYTDKLYEDYPLYPSGLIKKREHLLRTKNEIEDFKEKYISEQKTFFEDENSPKDFYAINSFDIDKGYLNFNIQDKIKRYIDFSVHYNSETTAVNDHLGKFINKVQNKFNEGFIPFNKIFNPYSGISYNEIKTQNELKLHKDIKLKILASKEKKLFLNMPVEDNLEIKATKLPATFNVVIEILTCKTSGEEIIYVHGLGDPSALNLISRFSDVSNDACQDIIKHEKEVNPNKIIADINCVGNFRSINVASTKQRYDYCIPVNTSFVEDNNPILLSDVYIHLQNNTFALVSKKYKKQILPKKVSAINSKLLESDVYNFLCDYEFYNQEIYGVNFNFNAFQFCLPYVPRIYLEKGLLLYPAQILLVLDDLSFDEFSSYLLQKITEHDFSKRIIISESHRKVILDTENNDNIILLYEKLKSVKFIYVSECLYDYFLPKIQRNSENFAHELIVSIKNPHYFRPNIDYSNSEISTKESQNVAVVSDWLYLELFCNSYADSEVFKAVYNSIILENKADQFFFVNYTNPERHLRLRFKSKSIENKQFMISVVDDLKSRNIIGKYQIMPYEQEIYRYGGIDMMEFSEIIFDLDSRDFLLKVCNQDTEIDELRIIAVLKIKSYLSFLGFSLDEMILHCQNAIENYSLEFEFTSQLRKSFNKEYASIKFKIDQYDYEDFLLQRDLQSNFINLVKAASNFQMHHYAWLITHMSMNRHFKEDQRYNEFKMYYFTKSYLNQIKFKQ